MAKYQSHRIEYGYRSNGDGHEVWADCERELARLMLGDRLWCGQLTLRVEDRALLEAAADHVAGSTPLHPLPQILHCAHSIYMKVVRETFGEVRIN